MSDDIKAPSETEQAAILSQPTPPHVAAYQAELRSGTFAAFTGMESVVPDDYFDGAELPAEKRQAAVHNLRAVLADTGLAPYEANGLFTRAGVVRSEGKSTETQLKEARAELKRQFGDSADQALNDARRLVQRDPRLAAWLQTKGLGNDSETLVKFARAARTLRNQGKLK